MSRLFLLTLILFLLAPPSLRAQGEDYGAYYGITCATRDTAEVFRPAPAAFLNGSAVVNTVFELSFTDEVPAVAQAAIRFAADVWGSYLDSPVPVRVTVDWADRMDNRLLASAGPSTLFRDFIGGEPGVWYPVALAEAVAGRDLNATDDADINVTANSTANWYFGTDGQTPRNRIDLVSVMLHELGHGLGFLSSVDTINDDQLSVGFGGRFIVYDLSLETDDGVPLTDPGLFTNPSSELLVAVSNNNLVFAGPEARQANGDADVPLFAPATFDVGSSVSHLSESRYPPGTENALMTPFLSAGEAVHDPGPVTLGLFADLGWPLDLTLTATSEPTAADLGLYPNPARDHLTVILPPRLGARTQVLYDASGRAVRRGTLPPGQARATLDVSGLAPGLYVLRLSGAGGHRTGRVLVR